MDAKKIKPLLCFDMDGTLISSNKAHVEAFNMAFIKNKLKPLEKRILEKYLLGETTEVIVKKLYKNLPKEVIKKIHDDKRKFIIEKTYRFARQIKNSAKILKNLKKYFRIAIASNCTHKEIIKLLSGAKIKKDCYNLIIGKDEVKYAKPYPDEIFKAEKLMKEEADFMIGDSLQDVKAAKRAKVKVIVVLTGNTTKTKLIKSKPDYIINDISYLKKILRGD